MRPYSYDSACLPATSLFQHPLFFDSHRSFDFPLISFSPRLIPRYTPLFVVLTGTNWNFLGIDISDTICGILTIALNK